MHWNEKPVGYICLLVFIYGKPLWACKVKYHLLCTKNATDAINMRMRSFFTNAMLADLQLQRKSLSTAANAV